MLAMMQTALAAQDVFRILVVDDDPLHRQLVGSVLAEPKYLVTDACNGQEALDAIALHDFDVVLMDKCMPGMGGDEVCRQVRQKLNSTLLPIVMVTGSSGIKELTASLQAGATDFICKPYSPVELRARVDSAAQHKRLTDHLDNAETLLFALARMVEAKDNNTGDHCSRLAYASVAFGRELGLSSLDLEALRRGGVLHDIGKLAVPDRVLLKEGPLTEDEWAIMKQHPTIGAHLCSDLKSIGTTLDIIHYHHERWDGSGYPGGLKGEQIPLLAQVFQLCDIYDALAHPRPYKPALSMDKIISIFESEVENGWRDPNLTERFIDILRHRPDILQTPANLHEDLGSSLYEGLHLIKAPATLAPAGHRVNDMG